MYNAKSRGKVNMYSIVQAWNISSTNLLIAKRSNNHETFYCILYYNFLIQLYIVPISFKF